MPVTINASPTNGLVQTADGSGIVKLQSNGVTTNALAWVNFNGTGTVAIRSSYNVSSITDNGTGNYTVNFTTALSDANYSVTGTAGNAASGTRILMSPYSTAPSTTAAQVGVQNSVFTLTDTEYVQVQIFGN
jgi:uncharacterized protein (AIM24 family)